MKVAALSCDNVESHGGWLADIKAYSGVDINYPIIADPTRYFHLPERVPARVFGLHR